MRKLQYVVSTRGLKGPYVFDTHEKAVKFALTMDCITRIDEVVMEDTVEELELFGVQEKELPQKD